MIVEKTTSIMEPFAFLGSTHLYSILYNITKERGCKLQQGHAFTSLGRRKSENLLTEIKNRVVCS